MGALNRVIEEVAYKQVEDMIVMLEMLSEQIIKTSKDAKVNQVSFGTPATSSTDMNKKLAESAAIVKKLQSEYNNLQKSYTDLVTKVDKYTTAKKNNTTAITNNSIAQSQLLKNVKEEEILNTNLTTYIQKLSVERIRASRVVADYNAQIAMGTALTEEQSAELAQATAQFQKYDTAIKAGKKSIGDAREYVGQYERANIGLSNSVSQIARELPAATYGFQTFALGVSNNIPIFVDEIKKAVLVNKELVSQGKEIVPVWKQAVSALFSFNTAMSIGLLLFALYGKEIANATKELFGFGDALDDAKKQLDLVHDAQEEYNRTGVESTTNYEKQNQRLKQLIAVMKDETKTDVDRLSAKDEIQSKYPAYFKNLTNEELLLGNLKQQTSSYNKALKSLTADLQLRADAEAKQGKAQNTLKLAAELQEEVDLRRRANQEIFDLRLKYGENDDNTTKSLVKNIEKRQELTQEDAKFIEKFGTIGIQTSGSVNRLGLYTDSQINELEEKSRRLIDVYQDQQAEASKLFVQTSLLDVKDSKDKDENTKSIKLNTKAREDYLASEYELIHLRLTNVANANRDIMQDEASGYDLRLMASEQYHKNLIDLANMEAKEELRILQFSTEEKLRTTANEFTNQKEQLDNWLKDGKISQDKYNKGLKDAEDTLQYDRSGIITDATNKQNIIYENQSQKLIEANKATVGQLKKIWDEINFGKADIQIGNIDLTNIQKLGEVLKGIGSDIGIEEIQRKLQEVSRIAKDNQNDINKREAQLALDRAERARVRLEDEIRVNGVANNLTEDQIKEQLNNNKALQDADQNIIDAKKRVAQVDNEVTQTQIDNQLKVLETQRKVDDAIYSGKLELYSSIKDLGGQLFENQIGDYDKQIEASNEYYDNLLANAEKGSEQEKLLQAEKQRAEEEIQKKKIDLQRKQAIFNKLLSIADIGIKLQAEIATNNATLGTIAAQPVNAFAIASAGVRIATVLATPLPQYKGGRGFGKEEDAIVDDGGRPEVIQREDGRIEIGTNKPRIVHLKPKDIVHKSLEDFNNSKFALENAAIMASFVKQSEQLQMFDNYLGRELNGLPDRIEKGIERGFKKVKINNNINTPSYDYQHHIYSNSGFRA